jgi:hypothetical protein
VRRSRLLPVQVAELAKHRSHFSRTHCEGSSCRGRPFVRFAVARRSPRDPFARLIAGSLVSSDGQDRLTAAYYVESTFTTMEEGVLPRAGRGVLGASERSTVMQQAVAPRVAESPTARQGSS